MARNIEVVGKVTLEYLAKYPDMASRTLARMLREEQPKVFCSIEYARERIRYYRGTKGIRDRQAVATRDFIGTTPKAINNPFDLPLSQEREFLPYIIGSLYKRILILPDIHCPYHNMVSLTLALEVGKSEKVDCIVLNGDTIDCYALSHYEKDPRERSFKDELDDCKKMFKVLRKHFPSARIIMKEGNHENRFERLLMNKAPEFLGVEEFQLKVLLDCHNFGIDYICDKRSIKVGHLNILHGDEYKGFGTVNPARSMFLKAKACTLSSHNHRSSKNTVRTINGDVIANWSTGCLCELSPKYMPYNDWNHGFAIVNRDGDSFEVRNKSVIGGKVYES